MIGGLLAAEGNWSIVCYFPVLLPVEVQKWVTRLSPIPAYSTVSGVNGPLVILDNVKVRLQRNSVFIRLSVRGAANTRSSIVQILLQYVLIRLQIVALSLGKLQMFAEVSINQHFPSRCALL